MERIKEILESIKERKSKIDSSRFYAKTSVRDHYSGSNEEEKDLTFLKMLRERLKYHVLPFLMDYLENKELSDIAMFILKLTTPEDIIKKIKIMK